MAAVGLALILKLITGITSASAERATALNHEIGDHAVKGETIIVSSGGEVQEGGDGDGGVFREKGELDVAFVGVDGDVHILGMGWSFE